MDDTFVFIEKGKQEEVLRKLNAYHENIRFTYELEEANGLPFLDVLVTRGVNRKLETSVYRKSTNTDIYMNWEAYAPNTWKLATLRSLVKRALFISSTERTHKGTHNI